MTHEQFTKIFWYYLSSKLVGSDYFGGSHASGLLRWMVLDYCIYKQAEENQFIKKFWLRKWKPKSLNEINTYTFKEDKDRRNLNHFNFAPANEL